MGNQAIQTASRTGTYEQKTHKSQYLKTEDDTPLLNSYSPSSFSTLFILRFIGHENAEKNESNRISTPLGLKIRTTRNFLIKILYIL